MAARYGTPASSYNTRNRASFAKQRGVWVSFGIRASGGVHSENDCFCLGSSLEFR
jgi:hypothetical protein